MDILREADKIKEEMISFRRALHQCPEIAFHEMITTEFIRQHMEQWEIAYRRLDPTGIIAFLGNGSKSIALRCDMDALEIQEETSLSYSSKTKGIMHACGHDGHMAILLAAAKILKIHESELKKRVVLIFQPAEETAQGAEMVIKTGVLQSVDEIFGVHIFNGIPTGKISVEGGARMASTNWFEMELTGKEGHGASPQLCIDATVAASALVMNLQTIVSRNVDPVESAVVSVGMLQSGTARNIISGHALLSGTVRTFSAKVESLVRKRLLDISNETAKMYQTKIRMNYEESSHPPLINDEKMAESVREHAKQYLPPDTLIHVPPMMLGEDFANYLKKTKGVLAFLGGGEGYPNHHGRFDFDEQVMENGLKLMLSYVMI